MECQYLVTCPFFKKHCVSRNLACQGFINRYCKGEEMNACKRLEYRKTYGVPPSEDMMPNGLMLKA